MTRDEWHDRFQAINGREPTIEEFSAALRNGEFQTGSTQSPAVAPAMAQSAAPSPQIIQQVPQSPPMSSQEQPPTWVVNTTAATPPVTAKKPHRIRRWIRLWAGIGLVLFGLFWALADVLFFKDIVADSDNDDPSSKTPIGFMTLVFMAGISLMVGSNLIISWKHMKKGTTQSTKLRRRDMLSWNFLFGTTTVFITFVAFLTPLAINPASKNSNSYWDYAMSQDEPELKIKFILMMTMLCGIMLFIAFPRQWTPPIVEIFSLIYVILVAGVFEALYFHTDEMQQEMASQLQFGAATQNQYEWNKSVILLLGIGFSFHLYHSFHEPIQELAHLYINSNPERQNKHHRSVQSRAAIEERFQHAQGWNRVGAFMKLNRAPLIVFVAIVVVSYSLYTNQLITTYRA